jgi:hypothetical protein
VVMHSNCVVKPYYTYKYKVNCCGKAMINRGSVMMMMSK